MALISSFDPRGMSRKELESWKNSGQLDPTVMASVKAKLAGMAPAQGGDLSMGTGAGGFNMADIRSKLQGTQKTFLDTQNRMIDRSADRAGEQGLSDMISSGLAGTTAVGGMRAAVAEGAGMQKSDLASRTQMQTDQLALQYATLASQNLNASANREMAGGGGFSGGGGGGFGGGRGATGATGAAGQAAEQLQPRPQVGGGGNRIGFNNAGERIPDSAGPLAPGARQSAITENSNMSYEQWWDSKTGPELKALGLTSLHAPGGPWAHLGARMMQNDLGN